MLIACVRRGSPDFLSRRSGRSTPAAPSRTSFAMAALGRLSSDEVNVLRLCTRQCQVADVALASESGPHRESTGVMMNR